MQFAQVKRAKGGRQQAKKSTLMCDVLVGLVNTWIHETKKKSLKDNDDEEEAGDN